MSFTGRLQFTNSLATIGFDYAYDARNAITKLTRYGSITGLATVGWTSFTYDSRGRLTNQQHRDSSNTSLNNTTFTYDNFDRLTTKVVNGTTTTYSYDNTNQLTDDGTASYSYDANGNRTMTGYTTGTGNQTTNDGTWTYSYDSEGNLSKKSKGASLETWNYSYNQQNHLVSVEKHATDGGTLQLKVQYKYDALDNRIERTEDSNGDGNVDTTERFGYDGQNVWADLDGNNGLTYRRLFGPGVDDPVARITAAGTVVWYLLDYQNSVIGMVDSTGSSLGSITYDGFGNILTNTTGVNGDRYGFTSREADSATGQQYNWARYYDPNLAKWTSMDPLGFEAGDANLYRYVGNGPTNGVDPSGQDSIDAPPVPVPPSPDSCQTTSSQNPASPSDPTFWDTFSDVFHNLGCMGYIWTLNGSFGQSPPPPPEIIDPIEPPVPPPPPPSWWEILPSLRPTIWFMIKPFQMPKPNARPGEYEQA